MSTPVFRSSEVRAALGLASGSEEREYASVSIDTRTLMPGALFVAIRGERFDGIDFLPQAAERGAAGAVVSEEAVLPPLDLEWFRVLDTTVALGRLAHAHRVRSGARIIGVTGSSGKTTVKEMIACALREECRTHATRGNLNNRIGLPLSILEAAAEADVWVLEMGASVPGEIAALAAIAEPDDAVITTVGPAHLEGFGDVKGVLREKLDLLRAARPAGHVVVGDRPPELARAARELRPDAVVAGLDAGADFRPERWSVHAEEVRFTREGVEFRIPAGGEHHLRDAVLAAAAAAAVGASPASIARGLERFRPVGLRSRLRRLGDLVVLADCYNANPESFEAAIRYCTTAFPGRRLAAVVGSMLELGDHSREAHRQVAESMVEAGFEHIVAVGEFEPAFRSLSRLRNGTTLAFAETGDSAWEPLHAGLRGDEVVLVKASRGVRLETVVEALERAYGRGVD